MILTGQEIAAQVSLGRILITPFDPDQITTNSYDLRIGDEVGQYEDGVLDPAVDNPFYTQKLDTAGMILRPDRIYLAATREVIGSDFFVPIVRSRSSSARLGLFAHVTADLVDIGYRGPLTLQLHAVQPLRIFPNQSIAQLTFWLPRGAIDLYAGKYQSSSGPTPSRSWVGWNEDRGRWAAIASDQD